MQGRPSLFSLICNSACSHLLTLLPSPSRDCTSYQSLITLDTNASEGVDAIVLHAGQASVLESICKSIARHLGNSARQR